MFSSYKIMTTSMMIVIMIVNMNVMNILEMKILKTTNKKRWWIISETGDQATATSDLFKLGTNQYDDA
ncbi:hypothetical protein Gotri_024049, partial [Gossypium trilobum]|nr:hypothetical protein [Gossypium trilobum]